ncbi:uncharacterized protein METZ01_LOCUS463341 [marine metagenome]|uniref:Uncharacterized protein n=1 Tax=marine metagenome TaxID=408172 RepID=A0A383ARN8_9ZZZZ
MGAEVGCVQKGVDNVLILVSSPTKKETH